jgi:hypothetical protein
MDGLQLFSEINEKNRGRKTRDNFSYGSGLPDLYKIIPNNTKKYNK